MLKTCVRADNAEQEAEVEERATLGTGGDR
jgi:hypothetical protein